jgi:hypothetical protein
MSASIPCFTQNEGELPMNQVKSIVASTVAVLSLTSLASSACADPQSVRVINSNANPVPVNGNVIVSGTANVNVANPVTVGNTTPIAVTVTNPTPPSTSQRVVPYQTFSAMTIAPGDTTGTARFGNDIPAGSRLVIEQIAAQCSGLPLGAAPPLLSLVAVSMPPSGTPLLVSFGIPLAPVVGTDFSAPGLGIASAFQTTRIYTDPPTMTLLGPRSPALQFSLQAPSAYSTQCQASLSGQLLPI